MRLPAIRTFVDKDGKILDPWLGPLQRLEPILPLLTSENITTLKAMINAAKEAEEEGAGFNLALPIDEEPLPDEDWFVTYKASAKAGRRVPMAHFESLRSTLISSTPLTGLASVSLPMPNTYTHLRLVLVGASLNGSGFTQIALSEDGGSTRLTAAYKLYNDAVIQSPISSTVLKLLDTVAGSAVYSSIIDIHDYKGVNNKIARVDTVFSSGDCLTGAVAITSTAPINNVEIIANLSNTYDSGIAELWGIP